MSCRLKLACAFGGDVVVRVAVVMAPIPSPRTEFGGGLLCGCCVAACVVCVFFIRLYTILLRNESRFCHYFIAESGLYAGFSNDQPELAFFPPHTLNYYDSRLYGCYVFRQPLQCMLSHLRLRLSTLACSVFSLGQSFPFSRCLVVFLV